MGPGGLCQQVVGMSLVRDAVPAMDMQDVKIKRPRHLNDIRAFSGASSMTDGTSAGISEVG